MPENELTWTDVWANTTNELGDPDEARRIVEYASGRMGASWLVIMSSQVPEGAVQRIEKIVERRKAGEPLQYVIGHWGFRSLDLLVDKRVLIPRPETEEVVEAALKLIRDVESPVVADLGTGSGAIALSIAQERPTSIVAATDESADALEVAGENLKRLSEEVQKRVTFYQGSWFDALPKQGKGMVDLVISNPPYVAKNQPELVEDIVDQWEPHGALYAGDDGLDDIRIIIAGAAEWLKPGGHLVFELAPDQSAIAQQLALSNGFRKATIGKDINGRDRWVTARK